MSDSTIYTIGTALGRARDQELPVQVLVEGQWLGGRVFAADGHGLVLTNDAREQSVIRMASISAVRVLNPAPAPRSHGSSSTAQTVPGPRYPADEHQRSALAISGSAN